MKMRNGRRRSDDEIHATGSTRDPRRRSKFIFNYAGIFLDGSNLNLKYRRCKLITHVESNVGIIVRVEVVGRVLGRCL